LIASPDRRRAVGVEKPRTGSTRQTSPVSSPTSTAPGREGSAVTAVTRLVYRRPAVT